MGHSKPQSCLVTARNGEGSFIFLKLGNRKGSDYVLWSSEVGGCFTVRMARNRKMTDTKRKKTDRPPLEGKKDGKLGDLVT